MEKENVHTTFCKKNLRKAKKKKHSEPEIQNKVNLHKTDFLFFLDASSLLYEFSISVYFFCHYIITCIGKKVN